MTIDKNISAAAIDNIAVAGLQNIKWIQCQNKGVLLLAWDGQSANRHFFICKNNHGYLSAEVDKKGVLIKRLIDSKYLNSAKIKCEVFLYESL